MAIALVSSASFGSADASLAEVTLNTTGADFLAAAVGAYFVDTHPALAFDGNSNSWTPLTRRGSTPEIQWFYVASPSVGSGHVVRFQANYPSLIVYALSGVHTSPFDLESAGGTAGSGTSIQPGSVTPSENNCLILAAAAVAAANDGESTSINSGFATPISIGNVSGQHIQLGASYKIQTSLGAENPTLSWTTSATAGIAAAAAVFKSLAGGGVSASHRFGLTGVGG